MSSTLEISHLLNRSLSILSVACKLKTSAGRLSAFSKNLSPLYFSVAQSRELELLIYFKSDTRGCFAETWKKRSRTHPLYLLFSTLFVTRSLPLHLFSPSALYFQSSRELSSHQTFYIMLPPRFGSTNQFQFTRVGTSYQYEVPHRQSVSSIDLYGPFRHNPLKFQRKPCL